MAQDQGLVPALKQDFYDKSETYTRQETETLVATGSSAPQGAIFKVRNSDSSYVQSGSSAVITDIRLIGETDYPVRCTQYGGDIPDSELTYDPVAGKVTIANMTLLNNHFIVIEAVGAIPTSGFSNVLTDIALLKQIAAPFLLNGSDPGGGMVLWNRPANQIPAGYREVVDWRGRLPMGYKPGDPDFGTVGNIGGSKTSSISSTNMLPKFRLFTAVNQFLTASGHPSPPSAIRSFIRYFFKTDGGGPESYELIGSSADNQEPDISPTSSVGQDTPDEFDVLNPYRIVVFIEFVGV